MKLSGKCLAAPICDFGLVCVIIDKLFGNLCYDLSADGYCGCLIGVAYLDHNRVVFNNGNLSVTGSGTLIICSGEASGNIFFHYGSNNAFRKAINLKLFIVTESEGEFSVCVNGD